MDRYTLNGLKDKYYKNGFEDALLLVLDLINSDPYCDVDDIKWEIKKQLNED